MSLLIANGKPPLLYPNTLYIPISQILLMLCLPCGTILSPSFLLAQVLFLCLTSKHLLTPMVDHPLFWTLEMWKVIKASVKISCAYYYHHYNYSGATGNDYLKCSMVIGVGQILLSCNLFPEGRDGFYSLVKLIQTKSQDTYSRPPDPR